jgi:UDP-N-acetylmuramate dehydrogenase
MIYRNVSLKNYNTFRLDYKAECLIKIESEEDALTLFTKQKSFKKPFLILGNGSNILFTRDYKGTILRPELGGIKVEEQDHKNVIISAGAGVNWDYLVEWTVNEGFGGLENLSLIPGMVGATPVQNIGAYGVEVKDTIEKIKAICIKDGSVKQFSNKECHFGYRDSVFKNELKGKYLITRVYYRLTINPLINTDYGSLNNEVEKLGKRSLRNVRQAVINIRRSKLPDPEAIGNAGSFFKNPVVDSSVAEALKKKYPQMPFYPDLSGNIKLSAGWLIDQCGWKGKRIGDAGVHDKQALVLVNLGKATGKELYELSEAIKQSVLEKFGVKLDREVEVI